MFRYSRCSESQFRVEHQFRHADDAVHGRADFVAHVGQEFALGPVGGFGRFLGPLQFRLQPFWIGDIDVDADDSVTFPSSSRTTPSAAERWRMVPSGRTMRKSTVARPFCSIVFFQGAFG